MLISPILVFLNPMNIAQPNSFLKSIWGPFLLSLSLFIAACLSFDSTEFIRWDTIHYLNIRFNGYSFNPCSHVNVAFFPLFPYLMKALNLSIVYTCLANLLIFYAGLFFLHKAFKLSSLSLWVYALLPTSFFFFVLYSESVFFISSALILYGLKKERFPILYLGVFLSGLARPVISILIPAFIVLIIWDVLDQKKFYQYKHYLLSIFIALISLFLVSWFQYTQTNTWWAMFKAQSCWDHYFSIKGLSANSWGQSIIQRLDKISVSIGLTATFILLIAFYKAFINKNSKPLNHLVATSAVYRFSYLYIAGITLSIWMFQNDWHSLDRYIWCSPFIILFINSWKNTDKAFIKTALTIYLLLLIPLGAYRHIQVLLSLLGVSVWLISAIYISNIQDSKINAYKYVLIIIFSILCIYTQWYFINLFLTNNWVG